MKAVNIKSFGGSDVLQVQEMPKPEPKPEEVLIEVYAASVNPADCKMREGAYPVSSDFSFPCSIGRDFSGVVAKCGTKVDNIKIGDAIFGVLPRGVEGTYQEYLTIDQNLVVTKPENLSHVEAAALALTGLTSLVSIEESLKLKSNERILIHGGAGGVGSFSVQLAHHIGSEVITTASQVNHEYLLDLGANQVIDYNKYDFTKILKNVDVVFDLIGGDVHTRSWKVLKPNGKIAYIAPLSNKSNSPPSGIQSMRPDVQRDKKYLLKILNLFEIGAVRVPQIETYPFALVKKAHDLVDTQHVRGKIVLKIK